MRILLDTNIIVSGLISAKGPPGQLLDAWLIDNTYELLISVEQLDELRRVLGYEKISRIVSSERVDQLLRNLDAASIVEAIAEVDASPDPSDNLILGAAVAGDADLVVSGDKGDMLALGDIEGIAIVSAAEAWRRVQAL